MAWISGVAKAHEFWIDPLAFQVPDGSAVVAHLRVGQDFEGSSYSYIPRNFRRFDYALSGSVEDVPGVVGDRPALNMVPEGTGLMSVAHVTTDQFISWDPFEKFVSFVEHKDAAWVLDRHAELGLAEDGTREVYSRYAKTLVAIADGVGADRAFGLLTELVALENPYTGDMGDGIDVRLLYRGEGRADAQIEVFEKASDGTVRIFTVRTDADGQASVPVQSGFRYMLDAVVLREPDPALAEERDVQWESLWANLTFEVPG